MQRKENVSSYSLSYWISWAMIGALAFLIMKLEVPIIPGFDYLKMDFSDALVALSTLVFGPVGGIMIALFKGVLSLAISGFNLLSLVGQVAAFLACLAYILPFYYISKNHNEKVGYQILGLVVGTLCLTIVMSLANYFVLTPLYIKFAGFKLGANMLAYIVSAIVPFNIVKGCINGVIVVLLAKTVLPPFKSFVRRHF